MIRTAIPFLIFAAMASAAGQTVTIAGTGSPGFAGDGGRGDQSQLNNPYGLVIGPGGALYICDIDNHAIRRLDMKTRKLTTVAGTLGKKGYAGDGGPAVKAQMRQPHSIAFDPLGRLMICDIGNHRVRRVDLKTGIMETWLGTGEKTATPDGAPLQGTAVNEPRALDLDPQGNLYLALRGGNAVYQVDVAAGKFKHLAGTGEKGYDGDGGDARKAKLSGPKGIAWSPDGGVYIADTESHTIRRIDLKSGVISTVIGTGVRGNGPDGDPLHCLTSRPHGIFVDRQGVIYVGDSEAHRVRMLKPR